MEWGSNTTPSFEDTNFQTETLSSLSENDFETFSSSNYTGMEYYYYNYDYYPEGNIQPQFYPVHAEWQRILRGHVDFTIALLTIFTNIIMASVFIFRSTRSPTTVLLTSLAISDAVICVCRMLEAMYFNILDNHETVYMLYRWCVIAQVFRYINQIFRFTSNWVTVILGFQRCISVAMPFRVRTICSMRVTFISILTVFPAAIILNIYEMFALEVVELKIYTTVYQNESLPSGCFRQYSHTVEATLGQKEKSMIVYYIFNGIFARILPVVILSVTTIILAVSLRKDSKTLSSYDTENTLARRRQFKRITVIIFTILIIFLIAELQDGVANIIYVTELILDKRYQILSLEANNLWDSVSSTLSLLSYACNFWIFFMMSTQFRSALVSMFKHPFKRFGMKWAFDTTEVRTSETNTRSPRGSGP